MRYGIAVIIIALFAVLGVVLLVNRNNTPSNGSPATKTVTLSNSNASPSASVSWTQQGRIVGNNQFNSIRVTITPAYRRLEILNGYQNQVVRSTDYDNNQEAYNTFTRALDLLKFGKSRNVSNPNVQGVCPFGNRFLYGFYADNQQQVDTWSDTCSTADGTYAGGNATSTGQLFRNQIPDYAHQTDNVSLY
jgi:hypothetical protein